MAAAIEAVLVSVNPDLVKGEQLQGIVASALEQTLRLQNPNVPLQRAAYNGIASLFDTLKKADAGESAVAGPSVTNSLKGHLFRADAGSEAVRLLRADAIQAVVKYSPTLATSLRSDILALARDERSTLVRDRLQDAAGAPGAS